MEEIITVLPFMPVAMLGMVIHFVKKKVQSGDALSWSDYWKLNRDKTLLAFLSIVAAVYIAYTADQLNGAAALFIGYAGDSILNRWDKKVNADNAQ